MFILAFDLTCPACRSHDVLSLAAPHPTRSMTSDGRITASALRKASCIGCGHGFHVQPLQGEERDRFYDDDYDVGLRDADADLQRARQYAEHIWASLQAHGSSFARPSSVIEFGCGSGALLKLIADDWQLSEAIGIEPAARLAETARRNARANMEVVQCYAESTAISEGRHDLALSVNVVEHAFEPVKFLQANARAIRDGGMVAVVCPDGNKANSELLFRDHVSSFSLDSMARSARAAGLHVFSQRALGGPQSGFQLFLLRKGVDDKRFDADFAALGTARNHYLEGWSEIERRTLEAIGQRTYAIYGIGEYADLLDAYCPLLADGALLYVVDFPNQQERNGKEIVSLEAFSCRADMVVVAAVNPRNWQLLKQKFQDLTPDLVHPYQFTCLRGEL